MAISTRTRDRVAAALQAKGVGLGRTIAQLRRDYPARSVRRTALLEAIADLEAMGLVERTGGRVRWVGPFDVERPFGIERERIERARALSPAERVQLWAELSESFLPRPR